MRIGIDAMGGDFAPEAVVLGTIDAAKRVSSSTTIVLYGDSKAVEALFEANGGKPECVEIVHTSEAIAMNEHPTQAFSQKSDSSIVVGFKDLKTGAIDGFASAGSTGAMMVGSMLVSKTIDGVIRPSIGTGMVTRTGGNMMLLDVGLNVDCKPEVLYQYGIIGSIYAKVIFGIENPRVALLNIGEEPEKGNAASREAHQFMAQGGDFNFVGNMESKHLLTGEVADVVVCDGFVGNAMLKEAEGFYNMFSDILPEDHPVIRGLNYENEGGTPVLGINHCVVIGHGCSTPKAIMNMILATEKNVALGLVSKFKEAFV